MNLSGLWRAYVGGERPSRGFLKPGFGGQAWPGVPGPAPWRSSPEFADANGPLLYRRRFEAAPPDEGRRAWLGLEGLFYLGDVWLAGPSGRGTGGAFFPPH